MGGHLGSGLCGWAILGRQCRDVLLNRTGLDWTSYGQSELVDTRHDKIHRPRRKSATSRTPSIHSCLANAPQLNVFPGGRLPVGTLSASLAVLDHVTVSLQSQT